MCQIPQTSSLPHSLQGVSAGGAAWRPPAPRQYCPWCGFLTLRTADDLQTGACELCRIVYPPVRRGRWTNPSLVYDVRLGCYGTQLSAQEYHLFHTERDAYACCPCPICGASAPVNHACRIRQAFTLLRECRRFQVAPPGYWSAQGVWLPAEPFRAPCCAPFLARPPHRWALLVHCQTARHFAERLQCSAQTLRRLWRNWEAY